MGLRAPARSCGARRIEGRRASSPPWPRARRATRESESGPVARENTKNVERWGSWELPVPMAPSPTNHVRARREARSDGARQIRAPRVRPRASSAAPRCRRPGGGASGPGGPCRLARAGTGRRDRDRRCPANRPDSRRRARAVRVATAPSNAIASRRASTDRPGSRKSADGLRSHLARREDHLGADRFEDSREAGALERRAAGGVRRRAQRARAAHPGRRRRGQVHRCAPSSASGSRAGRRTRPSDHSRREEAPAGPLSAWRAAPPRRASVNRSSRA